MLFASDLHFGKMASESIDAFLEAAEQDPDKLVVIAGDLTQDSRPKEYALCATFFSKLKELGVTIVTTVGNHDFASTFAQKFHKISNKYFEAKAHLQEILSEVYKQEEVVAYNIDELDSVTRVGNDIFVALCSQHRKCPRIKSEQVDWVVPVLERIVLEHAQSLDNDSDVDDAEERKSGKDGQDLRFHFVTHHSLWEDGGLDKHDAMRRRERLEVNVLSKFKFFSYVHGHNHRFTYQNTSTPKTLYRIRRLSLPTLSTRNKRWECGYVSWLLRDLDTAEPDLCHLLDGSLVQDS